MLAARQYGLVTSEQAMSLGLTPQMIRRRVEAGRWQRVHRGVYAIAGTVPSWRGSVLAACMRAGRDAVASHRTAARLWRFPNFEGAGLEVIAARGRKRAPPGVTIHQSGPLDPLDRRVLLGIPVTSAGRTLFDLATVADARAVGEAMDDALRRRLVTMPRLRWELSRRAPRRFPGTQAFRELVEQRAPGSPLQDSVLETRMLRLLRDAGFEPVAQYRIRLPDRDVFVDFAFPEARIAIEVDGYRWHSGVDRWRSDLDRRTALGALGWLVLHFTARDLAERPDHIVRTVARALQERAGA